MYTIITGVACLIFLRRIFFWVALWQTKEYRLDRLWVHITETVQGRNLYRSWSFLSVVALMVLYGLGVFIDPLIPFFKIAVDAFFVLQFVLLVRDGKDHRLKRPTFTLKALAISMLSLLAIGILVFFPITDGYVWLLLLLLLIPLLVALFVFFFAFPTELYTDYLCQKAKEKMDRCKKTVVIAVSGSYGKSSTKEIIAHVLSEKFQVVKTPLSSNTPLAIAKTILKKITPETEFFIVELGAYKKGEIAQLASMVGPDVSVTTAVSDQHLSLYGGLQGVIDSEMELLDCLPRNGLALFNGNSPLTQKLYDKTKQKKLFFTTKKKFGTDAVRAEGVVATKDGVKAIVHVAHQTIAISSPLLGMHTIENILSGIFLGIVYGLQAEDIQHAIKTLIPLPKTMQKIVLPSGIIGVDDTFNASPESCLAAAEYAKLYHTKKFFILTPLIELGANASVRHKEIGQHIAEMDSVFLTNENFKKDIVAGIQSVSGKANVMVEDYDSITRRVKKSARKGDLVVFEGKEAGVILKKLQHHV